MLRGLLCSKFILEHFPSMPRLLLLLQQLGRDKCFCTALLAGPVFWWLNHVFSLSDAQGELTLLSLFSLVLLYPLLEELSFRGLLQGALLQTALGRLQLFNITSANGLTSVLFAAFHLLGQSPLWAAAVLLPSLIFGALREKYNSAVPGIILHCFYNLGFLLTR